MRQKIHEFINQPSYILGYGITEVGVTHLVSDDNYRYKSVGKLLPLVKMKVIDV